jgi:hypothetical protein
LKRERKHLPTPSITEFAVLIRDEGYACRIWVESVDVAREILVSLSDAFVFKTSEPMLEGALPTQCNFRVAYGSHLSLRRLATLLSAIPGVRLKVDPAGRESD